MFYMHLLLLFLLLGYYYFYRCFFFCWLRCCAIGNTFLKFLTQVTRFWVQHLLDLFTFTFTIISHYVIEKLKKYIGKPRYCGFLINFLSFIIIILVINFYLSYVLILHYLISSIITSWSVYKYISKTFI